MKKPEEKDLPEKAGEFVEVKVAGLMLDPFSNAPIVILKDLNETITIPIWIGIVEASSIAIQLEKVQIPRPLTHDLLKNILETLGASVKRIEVTDLRDNTFFALIHLVTNGKQITIDSRPSDAIALALRTNSPIFVHEKVIEKSKKIDTKDAKFSEENRDKWADILADLKPEDFGKYKM